MTNVEQKLVGEFLDLTATSRSLLLRLISDAPNWAGNPMLAQSSIGGDERKERGNITDLKRKGLITSFIDDGFVFITFSKKCYDILDALNIQTGR